MLMRGKLEVTVGSITLAARARRQVFNEVYGVAALGMCNDDGTGAIVLPSGRMKCGQTRWGLMVWAFW